MAGFWNITGCIIPLVLPITGNGWKCCIGAGGFGDAYISWRISRSGVGIMEEVEMAVTLVCSLSGVSNESVLFAAAGRVSASLLRGIGRTACVIGGVDVPFSRESETRGFVWIGGFSGVFSVGLDGVEVGVSWDLSRFFFSSLIVLSAFDAAGAGFVLDGLLWEGEVLTGFLVSLATTMGVKCVAGEW